MTNGQIGEHAVVLGASMVLNGLAVTFGVLFAAWISRYRIGHPLVGLGRQTLPVYVIHVLWLAAIMAGVRYLDVSHAAAYALPAVLAVALTALSLLAHRLLVKAGATWPFELPSRLAYRAPEPKKRETVSSR